MREAAGVGVIRVERGVCILLPQAVQVVANRTRIRTPLFDLITWNPDTTGFDHIVALFRSDLKHIKLPTKNLIYYPLCDMNPTYMRK